MRRQVAEASCGGKFRRHVVKHSIRICIYVYTVYIYICVCVYATAVGDTTKAYFFCFLLLFFTFPLLSLTLFLLFFTFPLLSFTFFPKQCGALRGSYGKSKAS